MTQGDFEYQLRQFLRQEPFQPFAIDFNDGRRVLVDRRSLAFGGGAATYGTSDRDLVLFDCEEVREIHLNVHEMSS